MIDKLSALLFVLLVIVTCSATAQEPTTTPTTTATTPETTATSATTATLGSSSSPSPALAREIDSHDTRERLREILHRLPPEVGKVLKLDPSLWQNQEYLNIYPPLAAFVAAHPEVAHNPRFYLESVWIPSDPVPETAAVRVWRDMVETVSVMFAFGLAAFVFIWFVRTIVQHRRWARLSKVQAEVHNKLLDRFSSNEDVLAYINTGAGKKFLEAAPIPLETGPRATSAPVSRVLWSVQAGMILGALGIGLKVVSLNIEKEIAPAMSGLGVLAIFLGVGFILSAIVSLFLSRRLGLWSTPATQTAE